MPAFHRDPVDKDALEVAKGVMKDVEARGKDAVMEYATRFGDIEKGQDMVIGKEALKAAFDGLAEETREMLKRTADRIRKFAEAQRDSLATDMSIEIPGGRAGQDVSPVEVAGCYAPGGRYPLPSSVLMGAVTAKVAGVSQVWVASPRPAEIVKAAAYLADVEGLLAVGGCQAIAAFAYGAGDVPPCDAIVGPGNKFVTAAKSLVAGFVATCYYFCRWICVGGRAC